MSSEAKELLYKEHYTIEKVTKDLENKFQFNTAIAAIMELVNLLYLSKDKLKDSEQGKLLLSSSISTVLTLLYPIVPHLCEELWQEIGYTTTLAESRWPEPLKEALVQDNLVIVVQVNGKLRGKLEIPANTPEEEIKTLALQEENVQRHIAGKTVVKTIVVPKKLVNIVVK